MEAAVGFKYEIKASSQQPAASSQKKVDGILATGSLFIQERSDWLQTTVPLGGLQATGSTGLYPVSEVCLRRAVYIVK